jgi:cyclic beta-1,2-glucan synthetase
MILLFTPPFEHPARDPGYVGRYPPGVRENGGQYTHAAIWAAMAFARQGDGDRATELLRMLNPVEHARTPEDVARYKVEPYVVAADVYALEGQIGRGGWSWYTGSSGWMYRAWIEEILGFKLRGEQLTLDPVLPRNWQHVKIRYRHGSTHYAISIENPDAVTGGVLWVEEDGIRAPAHDIELHDDGADHVVTVRLGPAA